VKKHQKGTAESKGGILTKEAPIHYSNLRLIDPKDDKPCKIKVGFEEETGKKIRVSKRSDALVPKPDPPKRNTEVGPYDTPLDIAQKETYNPDEEEPFIQELFVTLLLFSSSPLLLSFSLLHFLLGVRGKQKDDPHD